MRPCGACRTLIPADTGCHHWRPGRSVKAADSAARRAVKRETKGQPPAPALEPVNRAGRKSANRRYQQQAREEAKARVAEFARIMGRTYR